MFDIGFLELVVVAVVALLVLGPERLPGAVRTAGLLIGRFKRGFADVKAQVEREIGADEIRQQLHNEQIMAMLEKKQEELQDQNKPVSNVKRVGNPDVTPAEQTTPAPEPEPEPEPDNTGTETPTDTSADDTPTKPS